MTSEQSYFELGRLQSPSDGLVFGLCMLVVLFLVGCLSRKDTVSQRMSLRVLLLLFRAVVWCIAAAIFLDPRWRTEIRVERPSRAVIAVDTSLSMSIADQATEASGAKKTRAARAADSLIAAKLPESLSAKHEAAIYSIGVDAVKLALAPKRGANAPADAGILTSVPWDKALKSTEDQSRLADSIVKILREEGSAPVAGILVVSDGRQTGGLPFEMAIKAAQEQKIPIYTVPVGDDKPPVNLRLAELQVPARAFPGDAFKIVANAQAVGLPGRPIPFELVLQPVDGKEKPVVIDRKELTLPANGAWKPVEFTHLPKVPGNWKATVRTAVQPGELRNDDNQTSASFEVTDKRTKVLLFAGGPGREYQFARNLLFRDRSMETSVLLQSAGEYLSQDADHVLRVFPDNRDDLFAYDVIICFDVDWARVEPKSRDLLVDWVGAQSGGLVLIAGPVFTPRLSRDETLAQILPLFPVMLKEIYTSDIERMGASEAWPIEFSSEGKSSELLSLSDDPAQSTEIWKEFQGVFWSYPITGLKPGATLLGSFSDPRARTGGFAPAIFASQFYGSGRVFYLGSAEMWRLRRIAEKYHDRFWVRLVRQMSQGRLLRGASRGALVIEGDRFPLGSLIPIEAKALNEEYKPLVAESVSVSVIGSDGKPAELKLRANAARPGRFTGQLPAKAAGEYKIQLLIPGTSEIVERRITVRLPELEFDQPRPDVPALTKLANETGGKVLSLDNLAEFPSLLEDKTEISIITGTPTPLWDKAWVMITVALLLSAEWLIRKLINLA